MPVSPSGQPHTLHLSVGDRKPEGRARPGKSMLVVIVTPVVLVMFFSISEWQGVLGRLLSAPMSILGPQTPISSPSKVDVCDTGYVCSWGAEPVQQWPGKALVLSTGY